MAEYNFGANILETLTVSMYSEPKTIYREYIQNACDSIDKAVREGVLQPNEGEIVLEIDSDARKITIEDNAMGIPAADFKRVLGNIGDSEKDKDTDKGFRGIGRLSGLGYCKQLIFTSKCRGEDVVSIMKSDGEMMRAMINSKERYSAIDMLKEMNTFEIRPARDNDRDGFKVEMIDVLDTADKIIGDIQAIKNYLAFVSPAPYDNSTFIYSAKIYEHARELNQPIDEYNIFINGERILKTYSTTLETARSGGDKIVDVGFKDFYDDDGSLLAWMWIGISRFKGKLGQKSLMRGIRLRKENIQIGDDNTMQRFFSEERAGNYFIGEVHAIAKDLIPDSQRDFFNENETWLKLQLKLVEYFRDQLQRIYHYGSDFNSVAKYAIDREAFEEKRRQGLFVDAEHLSKAEQYLEKSKRQAERARKTLDNARQNYEGDELMTSVLDQLKLESPPKQEVSPPKRKQTFRADKLYKLSRKDRELLTQVFNLISRDCVAQKIITEMTSEQIIQTIEEGLQ